MKTKAIVVINEQHNLMDSQVKLLEERFSSYKRLNVPATGWTYAEMDKVSEELYDKWIEEKDVVIVFASPIPALLKMCLSIMDDAVLIFHNDNRDKKELPNGKIIFTVAQEGWQLV